MLEQITCGEDYRSFVGVKHFEIGIAHLPSAVECFGDVCNIGIEDETAAIPGVEVEGCLTVGVNGDAAGSYILAWIGGDLDLRLVSCGFIGAYMMARS